MTLKVTKGKISKSLQNEIEKRLDAGDLEGLLNETFIIDRDTGDLITSYKVEKAQKEAK